MFKEIDAYSSEFATALKVGDLVRISTKDKPYKVTDKKFDGDEPRFGPLWLITLEEYETGINSHNDYIRPDGKSVYYYRDLSIWPTDKEAEIDENSDS